MPELPEVENFRQLLLPFVGDELTMKIVGDHPRVKIDELVEALSKKENKKVLCADVLRRGKQICLVLSIANTMKYLFLHMGMTGRIRVYGKSENWGERKDGETAGHAEVPLEDETTPPKFTYVVFSSPTSDYTAYFCDPRKFGSAYVADDIIDLESLAPDALTCTDRKIIDGHILPALTNQRLGIKAILLDQKRAVSGVGNWVADEVLYQCKIHPDQTKLSDQESSTLYKKLHEIVSIAVKSLKDDSSYPESWLFHYRWTGKKSGKDAEGRSISFITSGGRTTAIINTMQKLYARSTPCKASAGKKNKTKTHEMVSSPTRDINFDQNQLKTSDSSIKSKMTPRTKSKTVHNTNVADNATESLTRISSHKHGSIERNESKAESKRMREVTTESAKTKQRKVPKIEVAERKIILRRTSPRIKTEKNKR